MSIPATNSTNSSNKLDLSNLMPFEAFRDIWKSVAQDDRDPNLTILVKFYKRLTPEHQKEVSSWEPAKFREMFEKALKADAAGMQQKQAMPQATGNLADRTIKAGGVGESKVKAEMAGLIPDHFIEQMNGLFPGHTIDYAEIAQTVTDVDKQPEEQRLAFLAQLSERLMKEEQFVKAFVLFHYIRSNIYLGATEGQLTNELEEINAARIKNSLKEMTRDQYLAQRGSYKHLCVGFHNSPVYNQVHGFCETQLNDFFAIFLNKDFNHALSLKALVYGFEEILAHYFIDKKDLEGAIDLSVVLKDPYDGLLQFLTPKCPLEQCKKLVQLLRFRERVLPFDKVRVSHALLYWPIALTLAKGFSKKTEYIDLFLDLWNAGAFEFSVSFFEVSESFKEMLLKVLVERKHLKLLHQFACALAKIDPPTALNIAKTHFKPDSIEFEEVIGAIIMLRFLPQKNIPKAKEYLQYLKENPQAFDHYYRSIAINERAHALEVLQRGAALQKYS